MKNNVWICSLQELINNPLTRAEISRYIEEERKNNQERSKKVENQVEKLKKKMKNKVKLKVN